MKLQEVIANVGGLFKFLSTISAMVVVYLTRNSYYIGLLNENFRVGSGMSEQNHSNATEMQLDSKAKIVQGDVLFINVKKKNTGRVDDRNEKILNLWDTELG
jgi:hypothetical protein